MPLLVQDFHKSIMISSSFPDSFIATAISNLFCASFAYSNAFLLFFISDCSLLLSLSSPFVFSQQQIGNSDFEQWENVGAPNEEPVNWNSFKTASGAFASFASKQIEQSSSVRPGSSGSFCSRVYSVSTFGIVANGNMTIGKINMGSTSPAAAENYNYSVVSDSNFSEALTSSPDSIVFWVKYDTQHF